MAAPTFHSVGAIAGSSSTHTVTMPSHAADDIILLFLMSANESISLSSAEGFALIPGLSNGDGTAGGSTASRLDVYWVRATSASMVAPTVADSGVNTGSATMAIRGCIATGDPWDVVAGDATSGSNTNSVTIPGATTTVADCLVVLACSDHYDGTASRGLTLTNSDLTSITNRIDGGHTAAGGDGLVVATADRAAAGTVGSSTGTNTLATAGRQGRAFIALKPPTASFVAAWADGSNQGDHA